MSEKPKYTDNAHGGKWYIGGEWRDPTPVELSAHHLQEMAEKGRADEIYLTAIEDIESHRKMAAKQALLRAAEWFHKESMLPQVVDKLRAMAKEYEEPKP